MLCYKYLFFIVLSGCFCKGSSEVTSRQIDVNMMMKMLHDSNAVVIDSRIPFAYREGHIPGALNIPASHPELKEITTRLQLNQKNVIVYCDGPYCSSAANLLYRLRNEGVDSIFIFEKGWSGWQKVGKKR